jgi:acetyltransferase-like isoleucine patch superfamily enzyme
VVLLRALASLIRHYSIRRDPVRYARSIGVEIGEGCHFYASDVGMFGSDPYLISIGNNVHITKGVTFITHDGGTLILRQEVPDLELTAPIAIGNDVYIGVNAIILAGVTIGSRCIIGAGAVVTKSVPDNSVAVGVPARVVKTVDEYLAGAKTRSLHVGHLKGLDKEVALRTLLCARPAEVSRGTKTRK